MSSILSVAPTWRVLANILEIRFFARLYIWLLLVPLAAKALQKLPDQVDLKDYFGREFVVILELPFSWIILYWAAVCFVCARVLFIFYCPVPLRQHENAGEALRMGITAQEIRAYTISFLKSYRRALSKSEKRDLSKIFKRWGASQSPFLDLKSNEQTGDNFAEFLAYTAVVEIDDRPGYYQNPDNQDKPIEREQFIKLVYRFSDNFLNNVRAPERAVVSILLTVGFGLALFVFIQGATAVIKISTF